MQIFNKFIFKDDLGLPTRAPGCWLVTTRYEIIYILRFGNPEVKPLFAG